MFIVPIEGNNSITIMYDLVNSETNTLFMEVRPECIFLHLDGQQTTFIEVMNIKSHGMRQAAVECALAYRKEVVT